MTESALRGLSALAQPSLRQQCTQQLRALIVTGALPPGELHSIASAADRLGVSVTPVREAMLDLARDGLVEVIRNRGFRVVTLTDADLDELLELRTWLEVPAVEQLAKRRPVVDLAAERVTAALVTQCAIEEDTVGFIAHDRDLHLGILSHLGNRRLLDTVGRLRDQTRLYGLPTVTGSREFLDSAAEHDELLDLIEAGDAEAAGALMRRHLGHTRGLWAGREEGT